MKRLLVGLLLLAGCDGSAPMVQSPSKALSDITPRCTSNDPPTGYRGPVSPYSGSCADNAGPVVAPAGEHDYSKGMPPRVVR